LEQSEFRVLSEHMVQVGLRFNICEQVISC